jgi:prolipoprotein diacylglyceryltransferase
MVLGGAGQGQPSDVAWATAYLGPGPWSSAAPALPSHPSQAYEGIATLAVLLVLVLVLATIRWGEGRADGRLFLIGIGAWALVRAAAAMTWRDPAAIGPLGAGSVIALAIALGCAAGVVAISLGGRRTTTADPITRDPSAPIAASLSDSEERPGF